jgi:hypothetical protein
MHISILLSLEIFMKKHQENLQRKNSELDRENQTIRNDRFNTKQTVWNIIWKLFWTFYKTTY